MNSRSAIACESCGASFNENDTNKVLQAAQPAENNKTLEKNTKTQQRVWWRYGVVAGVVTLGVTSLALFYSAIREGVSSPATDSTIDQSIANVAAPAGVFPFSGDPYYAALETNGLKKAIADAHPRFELTYISPGDGSISSADGIRGVIKGDLAFATISRAYTDEERDLALKEQSLSETKFTLSKTPVALSATAFFTSKGLGVTQLTIEDLRGIFTGEITNWQQLGGPDLAIRPIGLEIESLEEIGLGTGSLSKEVKVVYSPTLAFREVTGTPGAIGFSNAALAAREAFINVLSVARVDEYFNPLTEEGEVNIESIRSGDYPIINSLFTLYRTGSEAGEAYTNMLLSAEGQQIFFKSGFVPLLAE